MPTPEDCPMIGRTPAQLRTASISSSQWFWPFLFTVFCSVFAAGAWYGRIGGIDNDRAAIIAKLEAADAALATRLDNVSLERVHDSERLARLEVMVSSFDKKLDSAIDAANLKKPR